MLHVLGHVLTGHQNVGKVDEQEWQVDEDCIHHPLESLGRVLETKRHVEELEQTEQGDVGRLGDVIRMHGNLVVPADEVHLAEDLAAM